MNYEFLADRILNENFLSKKALVEILESNFENLILQGVRDFTDDLDKKKIALMDNKIKKLEENSDISIKLGEIKRYKEEGLETSPKRFYSLKSTKKKIGVELQKINMELNKLNLMKSGANLFRIDSERNAFRKFIKDNHSEETANNLIKQI